MTADEILALLQTDEGRRAPYLWYERLHELGPVNLTPASTAYAAVANGYAAVDQILRDPRFVKGGPPPALLGADGPVDFIAEFGYLLPAGVMSALPGIPAPDLDWFRTRVQRVEDYLDFGGRMPEKVAAANQAAVEMSTYYQRLIDDRRVAPGNDLISGLVRVIDADDGALTDEELVGNLLVLFNASFVTTINLLCNTLPPVLERPALVKSLAADPLVFDVERPDKLHIAFGAGAYFCIGAVLARAEGRRALPRLFQRFPDLALAGPPVQSAGPALRGLATIPVTLT